MEHYVTLFDSGFLPQGLALYRSLERHGGDFRLWVLCVDAQTFDILSSLDLSNMRLIAVADVESDELRAVRGDRSRGEYCWTLTPFAPKFVLDADSSVRRVTYLDADFWFRKSPKPILEELQRSGKSVLITDHAYAPDYDQSATTGQFCVQLITFERNRGEVVREWWADRCLEWCFARFEDGKFGDQKYLDDWEERFSDDVHVLRRQELVLAPWNAARFPYGRSIAYHFHNLRLVRGGRVILSRGYDIPRVVIENVYKPYLQDLAASLTLLRSVGHEHRPRTGRPGPLLFAGVSARKLWRLLGRIRPISIARLPEPVQDTKSS